MKRWILILVFVFVLAACDLPAPTPTEPPPSTLHPPPDTETPLATSDLPATVTALPWSTATPTPEPTTTDTPEPTVTETPSATPAPEAVYSERLENGDFEEGFAYWPTAGGYVGTGWKPVIWRDFPIPLPCEEGQTIGCNPEGLSTRNPEYGDAPIWIDKLRVLSGAHSQKFFCAGEHCFAGIAQTFDTQPGEHCTGSVWAQTWGAAGSRSCWSNTEYRSDYCSEDDMANMHILVVINTGGDGITFPFPDNYLVADYGYDDGIYDEPDGGAPVSLEFTATGEQTTIAFIGYQLFPVAIADWYLDLASVWCEGEYVSPVEPTPTPRATMEALFIEEGGYVLEVEAQGLDEESSIDLGENDVEFTDVAIAGLVAAVISLVLEVVPGINDLWGGVAKKYKSLIILGLSVAVPFAVVGLSCMGVDVGFGNVCPNPNNPQLWFNTALLGISAFFASQITFEYASSSLGERVKKA